MENEKVKKIKKYFEERAETRSCLLYKDKENDELDVICFADILTLINELESVNKWLLCKAKEKNNEIDNYTKENEQLKNRIAELENKNDEKHKRIMELEQDLIHADENVFYREQNVIFKENEIKSKALKQFAERIKMEFYYEFDELIPSIMSDKIDKLLKELQGE